MPNSLSATAVSAGQVNVTWVDNATTETGFRIQRATNNSFTANLITATAGANATSYSDSTVAGSTTYYYRVFAYNSGGDSTASNAVSVTTPASTVNPPSAPTSLTATAASATQVNLTWAHSGTTETGFRIQRASNSSFTTNLVTATAAANATSYSDTSVTSSTTYYYRVFAYNSGGDSAASNTVSVTTPAVVTAPLIVHTTTGYTACLTCHSTFTTLPSSHVGRTNSTCSTCHQTSGSTSAPRLSVGAPRIPHSLSSRQDCLSCHARGASRPFPSNHTAYQNITCTVCHRTG